MGTEWSHVGQWCTWWCCCCRTSKVSGDQFPRVLSRKLKGSRMPAWCWRGFGGAGLTLPVDQLEHNSRLKNFALLSYKGEKIHECWCQWWSRVGEDIWDQHRAPSLSLRADFPRINYAILGGCKSIKEIWTRVWTTHFNLFKLLIRDILDVGDVAAVSRAENYE